MKKKYPTKLSAAHATKIELLRSQHSEKSNLMEINRLKILLAKAQFQLLVYQQNEQKQTISKLEEQNKTLSDQKDDDKTTLKEYITSIKPRYGLKPKEPFGYDPDTFEIITDREE